jgi:hypothetical protein
MIFAHGGTENGADSERGPPWIWRAVHAHELAAFRRAISWRVSGVEGPALTDVVEPRWGPGLPPAGALFNPGRLTPEACGHSAHAETIVFDWRLVIRPRAGGMASGEGAIFAGT